MLSEALQEAVDGVSLVGRRLVFWQRDMCIAAFSGAVHGGAKEVSDRANVDIVSIFLAILAGVALIARRA